MSTDTLPTQIAEIRKDVEYLRREHDREVAENEEFRREARRRLLAIENAALGLAAVTSDKETSRTRITWIAALLFGCSGMVVGILSVVIR